MRGCYMKNKYQRLSKEDRKECRSMYYSTTQGKSMHIRLFRLLIIGTIGILFSIFMIGNGLIQQNLHWYDYAMAIPLFLISIVFIVGSFLIKRKVLNQFALKIPRFKNKRV